MRPMQAQRHPLGGLQVAVPIQGEGDRRVPACTETFVGLIPALIHRLMAVSVIVDTK